MRVWIAGLAAVAIGLCAAPVARAADPDALWKIVHGRCVPDRQEHGSPAPCVSVDLQVGAAVLKDIVGATQFLLIPTAKVAGMESPEVFAPDAPNYFAAAWAAKSDLDAAAHMTVPRDLVSLAINSAYARTQNQLHIHIDCLRPDIAEALHAHAGEIGQTWSAFPGGLMGHAYIARRVDGETLADSNPLRLLAAGVPEMATDPGRETLVAAGMTFPDGRPGFVLLADRVDVAHADMAGGEELQDHSCAILRPVSPGG